MTTWIKLHRGILDWEWYSHPPTCRLFTHLLLTANYKTKRWRGCEVRAGQLITGRKSLAEQTGLTEQQIRTALNNLQKTNEITIKSTNKFTLVTIVNWEMYQEGNQQSTSNQPAINQQSTSNQPQLKKERKKEGKNIYNTLTGMLTEAVKIWNTELSGKLPNVKSLSEKRKKKLTKLLKMINVEEEGIENFRLYCRKIAASSFLTGASGKWQANFDWALEEANMLKIVEGNYDNKQ